MNALDLRVRGSDSPDLRVSAPSVADPRAILRDMAREAVTRYLAAKARCVAFDASRDCSDEMSMLSQLACDALIHAEGSLIDTILAFTPGHVNECINKARKRLFPRRGIIVDGSLYAAAEIDDGEMIGMGETHPAGVDVMRLQVVPLADVHDLDGATKGGAS